MTQHNIVQEQPPQPPRTVSLVALKTLVKETLPRGSAFREVVLQEPDELTLEVFVAKAEVLLTLLRRDL